MPTPKPYIATNGVTTWRVRFRVHDPLGDLVNTSETFATFDEAKQFCDLIKVVGADEAVRIIADRRHDDASPTLDAWMARYITSRTGITDGTRVDYDRVYRRTWHPRIGNVHLAALTRERVAAAVNDLSSAYSDKSVKNAWGILAGAMRQAQIDGVIERNPCNGMRLPRRTEHKRTRPRFLSHADFDRLLEEIPEHWRPLVMTLAGTGMRWGEAQALTVADVDLDAAMPVVRIFKAAKWTGVSRREIGPTKTAKSTRTVLLPPQVVELLWPLVATRPGDEPLFTTPDGDPIAHKYFWAHVWRPAVERAGLKPPPRIHDLRHTHVAWLVEVGIGLPAIQERLGHEKITTTMDTYGGLMPDLQVQAARAAALALSKVKAVER